MFRVNRRHRWLISKSSFSRQCLGRIRDTHSQLTWKSHSPHTHGGTFWPTLNPGQTLYPHESCQNKQLKSEVCKMATSPFDMSVASSSVVFMMHTASWYETKGRFPLPEFTGRVDGPRTRVHVRFPLPELTARVDGCQKMHPTSRPVNSGRELG